MRLLEKVYYVILERGIEPGNERPDLSSLASFCIQDSDIMGLGVNWFWKQETQLCYYNPHNP